MKLDSTIKSPKTTAAAVLLVVYTIARAAYHLVDGDDATVPDLDTVAMAVIAAVGFLFSRYAQLRLSAGRRIG